MGGLEGAGGAGAAGGGTDPLVGKKEQDPLPFHELHGDGEGVGETVSAAAVDAGVRDQRGQFALEAIAQFAHAPRLVRHVLLGKLARLTHGDDRCGVLGARPAPALLVSADQKRTKRRAAAHEEDADALRSVQLVPGKGEHIDGGLRHVQRDLPYRLHRVGVEDGTLLLHDPGGFLDREDDAGFVVRVHE